MNHALKSVPGIADARGSPWEWGWLQNSTQMSASKARYFGLKATSLVLAGRSGMDKNPPFDSYLLPSLCRRLITVHSQGQCGKRLLEALKGRNSKKQAYHVDQRQKLMGLDV